MTSVVCKCFTIEFLYTLFRPLVKDGDADLKEHNSDEINEHLTSALLTNWYKGRIYQLERYSHLVDPPLDLIKLARERYVKVSYFCIFVDVFLLLFFVPLVLRLSQPPSKQS